MTYLPSILALILASGFHGTKKQLLHPTGLVGPMEKSCGLVGLGISTFISLACSPIAIPNSLMGLLPGPEQTLNLSSSSSSIAHYPVNIPLAGSSLLHM